LRLSRNLNKPGGLLVLTEATAPARDEVSIITPWKEGRESYYGGGRDFPSWKLKIIFNLWCCRSSARAMRLAKIFR
jgi:hypothetical protein